MNRRQSHPVLHLVNDADAPGRATLTSSDTATPAPSARTFANRPRNSPAREERRARAEVAKANLLASGMSPMDARWTLARRVTECLEGGRAAILTPDRRERLVATALRLGVREFDAHLIIAIVQDGRRSGQGALNPEVEYRLAMVRQPEPVKERDYLGYFFVAGLIAIALGLAMILWITGPTVPIR